jgi:CheY-like chemotaxis protein/HPt (histidine-containing phosphotransfer) domain-containing protein
MFFVMAFKSAEPAKSKPDLCLKILVVDDDEMSRRMMRLLLTREGHDVQVAANGVEAVEAVKEQWFDIVFMDLQMPLMDGLQASQAIREWENGGTHTYIVALTASYMPEHGHRLYDAGIDNYLSKPFEVDHIQKLLDAISRAEHIPTPSGEGSKDSTQSSEVLDIQKGRQRVGGDLQTYKELLSDFVQELPDRMKTLEQLIQLHDQESLSRAAHNLKGVSSNLGALELAEWAAKLDKQSIEGYTDLNQGLILELKKAEANLQKTANDFLTKERPVSSH